MKYSVFLGTVQVIYWVHILTMCVCVNRNSRAGEFLERGRGRRKVSRFISLERAMPRQRGCWSCPNATRQSLRQTSGEVPMLLTAFPSVSRERGDEIGTTQLAVMLSLVSSAPPHRAQSAWAQVWGHGGMPGITKGVCANSEVPFGIVF